LRIDQRLLKKKLRLVIGKEIPSSGATISRRSLPIYVDKTSKFLVARVMKTQTTAELNRTTEVAFAGLPASHLKTFTFDNGQEFSGYEQAAGLGVE
jgi:IS30 family transposase